jgi:hypothetical protein
MKVLPEAQNRRDEVVRRKEIRDCTGYSCPLYAYRPYQIEGEEE